MSREATKIHVPAAVRGLINRLIASSVIEEVVLFGSAIDGTMTPRSDVDVLVVTPSQAEAEELMRRQTQLTARLIPRVDLAISSKEEIAQARGERGAFLRSVRQHGVFLYSSESLSIPGSGRRPTAAGPSSGSFGRPPD